MQEVGTSGWYMEQCELLREENARLRAEVQRRVEELRTAQDQMAEIAASNADHIRWHREMEAKLARLTAAVESYRGTYLVSKSGTHLGDPAGEILAAAAKEE